MMTLIISPSAGFLCMTSSCYFKNLDEIIETNANHLLQLILIPTLRLLGCTLLLFFTLQTLLALAHHNWLLALAFTTAVAKYSKGW
jgi:hypothetical protein